VGRFFNAREDVHAIFKACGIDTLLLGGVSTGGAVAATVVQVADLDYRLFVVEESCADRNKEMHEFFMKLCHVKWLSEGWYICHNKQMQLWHVTFATSSLRRELP
jgi:nicotinamidase-related amidase